MAAPRMAVRTPSSILNNHSRLEIRSLREQTPSISCDIYSYPVTMHYILYALGCLTLIAGAKARHNKLFTSHPAFADHPFPTIPIECPELGRSGVYLDKDHTSEGAGLFPALTWPAPADDFDEYLLISEDPDAPIPDSVIHGIYYRIPREKTGVQNPDFRVKNNSPEQYILRGGFKYGKNRHGTVYMPPSPFFGHGPHRYFFELIALNNSLETDPMNDMVSLDEVRRAIQGKVAGWGEWVGVFESPSS